MVQGEILCSVVVSNCPMTEKLQTLYFGLERLHDRTGRNERYDRAYISEIV